MPSHNEQQPENDKSKRENVKHDRTITNQFCTKHSLYYPKGERCPRCEAEERDGGKTR